MVDQMMEQTQKQTPNQETGQMDPKTQEQFDLFVINGMNIIHNKDMTENILTKVMHSDDPIRAIAEVTVDIINRLMDSAGKSNIEIKEDVLIYGGNILMGEIMQLLESAGMSPLNDEQKTACWQFAVSLFLSRGVNSGKIKKNALVQQANQMRKTPVGQEVMQTAQKPEMNQMEELPNG